MFEVIISVLCFFLIVILTFINGYWLITLDELELDHLNPADVAKKLNRLVFPEIIAHGILLFLLLISWSPIVFILNLPIAVWHILRIQKNEHILDPTEILKYKKLKEIRYQAIAKTAFYAIQIIYGMYWMVSSIVTSSLSSRKSKYPKTSQSPIPSRKTGPKM